MNALRAPCAQLMEDYHYAASSDEVNELTGELLEELPSEIHLIITSRVWPEIRQLPKMVSQRQVSVLDTNDLIFSSEEVAAFLRLTTGSSPSDEEVRELFDATRGWPACVALLGAHGIPYGAVSQESSGLYAYFAAEILRCLPLQVARFMLQTSVLPMITTGLGNELLKGSDSAALIRQLLTRRLLQPSHGRRDAYQYHPLMREFLLARLLADSTARYKQLHIQAADMFRRHGSLAESVELLTAVEAWSELADLLEEMAPKPPRQGKWDLLSEWLDRFPDDFLLARDELMLLRSKLAYLQRDSSRALRLLESAKHLLAYPEGLVIKAAALSLQGRTNEAIRLAKRALDLATRAEDMDAASNAQLWLGVSRCMKGSYGSAEQSLRRALRHFVDVGDLYNQAVCDLHLAGICHFRGRVDEETVLLESAEQLWRKLGNREQLARTLNNLGLSHHQRGNYEAALRAYTECLYLARGIGAKVEHASVLIGLADLFRDQFKLSRSEKLYQQGIDLAKELDDRILYVYALSGRADLKRLEGELDAAEATVKQALVEAVDHDNPQEEGVCLRVLGAVYRDQGKLSDACLVLTRAGQLHEQAGSRIEAAKAKFLLGSALFRSRQRSRALNCLEEVVDIARAVEHDQFVLPLISQDLPLIQYAAAKLYSGGPFSQWLARTASCGSRRGRGMGSPARMPSVELRALGDFVVLVNGMPVSDLAWQTTKAKEMFLYLAVRRGSVSKEEIIEALWPDLPGEKCNSYFHSTLHRIRGAVHPDSVIHDGPRYSLNPEVALKSDVADFLLLIERCGQKGASLSALRRAVSLYSGPFAPEVYSDWAGDLRSQLESQYLWALDRLLRHAMRCGKSMEVATLCEKLLEVDPFHELAWKELIQYHQGQGHLGLALRLYRRCSDAFVKQLGVEVPSAIKSIVQSG